MEQKVVLSTLVELQSSVSPFCQKVMLTAGVLSDDGVVGLAMLSRGARSSPARSIRIGPSMFNITWQLSPHHEPSGDRGEAFWIAPIVQALMQMAFKTSVGLAFYKQPAQPGWACPRHLLGVP
jgi:hypothetical protein